VPAAIPGAAAFIDGTLGADRAAEIFLRESGGGRLFLANEDSRRGECGESQSDENGCFEEKHDEIRW